MEFDASDMFDVEQPGDPWEVDPTAAVPPEVAESVRASEARTQAATPSPSPTPPPAASPRQPPPPRAQGRSMYEPDDNTSAQWAPYDNTSAIPPVDDMAADVPPVGAGPAPSGRAYGMYRQPPTWQHASLGQIQPQAVAPSRPVPIVALLQGLSAIVGGALLGYGLTGSAKVAAGSGLGMLGMVQLPTLLEGQILRPLAGLGAMAGAYALMRDDLEGFDSAFSPNEGGYEDEYGQYEDLGEEEDDEPEPPQGQPGRTSPWLRES